MMRDRPNGPELLTIALETLRAEILPAVPKERRLTTLMIANALSIAMREGQTGDQPLRASYHRLADLAGEEPARIEHHVALMREERRLSAWLVKEIRAGNFDAGEPQQALRRHLMADTLAKLREANPKYLGLRGLA